MHPSTLLFYIKFLFVVSGVASGPSLHRFSRRFYSSDVCKAEAKDPWSYKGKNGPEYWGYRYPSCNGVRQSPISINSRYVIYDPKLEKLTMYKYDIPVSSATIENDGHTVITTPTDKVQRAILVRGTVYRLQQFHFHWGDKYYQGSEHFIDGIQYALELHFVHRSAEEKISVVSVLFEEQSVKNAELLKIVRYFPNVMYNGTRTEMHSKLKLENLLPKNPASFYHYQGSLTTPECDEGVDWFVLTYPLPVGKKEMAEFRKLYSTTEENASFKCKISNNFRPVQPLNHRKVYMSQ